MGIVKLPEIEDHWRLGSAICHCLSRVRFSQIHRAFTVRDPETNPQRPEEPWWFRVEPLANNIRQACQRHWIPGGQLTVDEVMVAYHGHTRHTVKAPHKPIKQGFKIWALGDHGYIWNWLWYSKASGTEGTRRTEVLAETQVLVLNLAKTLPHHARNHTLYLDNLFTNVPLAKALLEINIGVMGTTRKNALGYPQALTKLKNTHKALKWGAFRGEVIDGVLCFIWQDNSGVLGITTAFSPSDIVVRTRKRPAKTSTSAAIVRPVFGDAHVKDLPIPTLIDAYNHHMGGVDIANQLRATYSTHWSRQNRYWKPLFLWLLDISITNAYFLSQPPKNKRRSHLEFMKRLAIGLMFHDIPISETSESTVTPEPSDGTETWGDFCFKTPGPIAKGTIDDAEPATADSAEPIMIGTPEPPTINSTDSAIEPMIPIITGTPERTATAAIDSTASDIIGTPEFTGAAIYIDGAELESTDKGGAEAAESLNFTIDGAVPNIISTPEPIPAMAIPTGSAEPTTSSHLCLRSATRAYCAYCRQHKEDWIPNSHFDRVPHGQQNRAFGTDITNIGSKLKPRRIRGSLTIWNCGSCRVPLCKRGKCWQLWHESLAV